MTVASTTVQGWADKLRQASQGDYQVLQSLKDHIFEHLDPLHPIFKQSFYDILQQGYLIHELQPGQPHRTTFETYKQIGMLFLLQGTVQIRCINLEADNETLKQVEGKGIIEVTQQELAQRYGADNVNLITKFEIQAAQKSVFIEVLGKNQILQNQITRTQPISQKQHNVMRKFLIFPSKNVQRVIVNSENKAQIMRKFYLLSGKVCFFLEKHQKSKNLDNNVILTSYHEGYFNPSQFGNQQLLEKPAQKEKKFQLGSEKKKMAMDKFPSKTPSKIKRTASHQKKNPETPKKESARIKMYIFEGSEIMYFEQDFMKDDYVKALEQKRKQHLDQIINKYQTLSKEEISSVQDKLILKYKLPRKEVNLHVYKIPEIKKEVNKGLSSTAVSTNERLTSDKAIKSRNDLRSTSSSVKCSLRIRKVKKN